MTELQRWKEIQVRQIARVDHTHPGRKPLSPSGYFRLSYLPSGVSLDPFDLALDLFPPVVVVRRLACSLTDVDLFSISLYFILAHNDKSTIMH